MLLNLILWVDILEFVYAIVFLVVMLPAWDVSVLIGGVVIFAEVTGFWF